MQRAANVGSEPMLQDVCFAASVGCQETVKNLQQGLGFGMGFSAAFNEVVCACSKNERIWNGLQALIAIDGLVICFQRFNNRADLDWTNR